MTIKPWMDTKYRVVSLDVLECMCESVSGTCHRYQVTKVTGHRVYVEYSNPNEYASEFPMTAVFPCYKSGAMVNVVLDIIDVRRDNWDGEGWQAFQIVLDADSSNPNLAKAA